MADASAEDEVAGLDRVLTRLALTEEAQLERVRGTVQKITDSN